MASRPFTTIVVVAALMVGACSGDAGDGADGSVPAADAAASDGAESTPDDVTPEPTAELIPDDAIVVGAISDHTGLLKAIDEPALDAARVQVARINEAGGVLGRPLVLAEYDTRSQLNDSFQAANELAADGAEMFLVTCDYDFARPAIEVAATAGILVLSPCGGTDEWGNPAVAGRHVFSFAMPDAREGALLADLVLDEHGPVATVIVDTTDPDAVAQCAGFVARFRAEGGRLRGVLEVDDAMVPDLEENVAELVATAIPLPDAVLSCTSPTLGDDVVQYLRRAGLSSPIMAGSTMDGDDWIANVETVGDMSLLSYASVFGDDPDPAVTELVEAYARIAGEPLHHGQPVTGADAIEAFAVAAERAGTLDVDDLIAELERFDRQELVAGTVTFSATAHLSSRSMRLLSIVDRVPQFVRMVGTVGTAEPSTPTADDSVDAAPTADDGGDDGGDG